MSFVIIDEAFRSGVMLGLSQNLNAFNAASRGAIRLEDARLAGEFVNDVRWDLAQDIWTDRDPTSTSAIASGDRRSVGELNQRGVIVPIKAFVTNSVGDLARSIRQDAPTTSEQFSRMIGQWVAATKLKRQLNDGLLAARAALKGQTTPGELSYTVSSGASNSGKAHAGELNIARAVMGDMDFAMAGVLIMHSKPWFDLVGSQVAEKYPDVVGFNLFKGIPATFGIPTLVIDSPALVGSRTVGSATVTEYYTLGLVPEAVTLKNNTQETVVAQAVTGAENIVFNVQAQGDHSIHVKGFQWDVNAGGAAPDQTDLGTSTNWDPIVTGAGSQKLRAGFCYATL